MGDIFLILFSVMLTSAGNILQKSAASGLDVQKTNAKAVLRLLFRPVTMAALACMGFGAASWLVVLSKAELSFAYPFVSLGFVFILLFSKFVFKEQVPTLRFVGAGLIVCGIILVAGS